MISADLAEAVGRLLRDRCSPEVVRAAEEGKPAAELWETVSELGLPLISVPEERGGSGGTLVQACEVLFLLGRAAAPVPLAETALLGGWLLAAAGLDVPTGRLTAGPVHIGEGCPVLRAAGDSWTVSGDLRAVPWARSAAHVASLAEGADGRLFVARVPSIAFTTTAGRNLAGEHRDDLKMAGARLDSGQVAPAPEGVSFEALFARGALARAALMAGALHRVAEMTVAYAGERHQFGKPLNSFQAVQNLVVQVAEQAECVALAVMVAAARFDEDAIAHAAVVKATAGRAARLAARMAHEVHGAIGVTLEHDLGLYTRRLHAWAGEFGSERHWNRMLGRRILAAGPTATRAFLSGEPGALP